jgi:UDP-N-acetylglucosamine 2-epimerase (non-hydrolysing)/GDP/UDP-N,N'-diacetylbacillosamine 2-epimerase (hydrolysing)
VRTLGIVTVARSDYGIYLPILRRLQADPDLRFYLLVSGMHLSPEFGLTVSAIDDDGFEVGECVEMLLSSDTPEGIAKSIGLGVIGFAQAYTRRRPDILVVLGDRFEMYAAALAALPFKIPVAHIHGGEVTQGAIDDALRHAMTKLSHLHFTATPDYARRVRQLGEESWRVMVSGAPALDNLRVTPLLTRSELETTYRLCLPAPPLLVTFHPVTLEYEQTAWQMGELLAALEEVELPVVFTLPNADTQSRVIIRLIEDYVRQHPSAQCVAAMGTQGYFSLMSLAAAMVGNSSSGLIEAPAFELPVVNIGSRQTGRVRAANVIDVGYGRADIAAAIYRAVAPEFRASLHGLVNPYGDGGAAERIVARLKSVELSDRLIRKVFQDYAVCP